MDLNSGRGLKKLQDEGCGRERWDGAYDGLASAINDARSRRSDAPCSEPVLHGDKSPLKGGYLLQRCRIDHNLSSAYCTRAMSSTCAAVLGKHKRDLTSLLSVASLDCVLTTRTGARLRRAPLWP